MLLLLFMLFRILSCCLSVMSCGIFLVINSSVVESTLMQYYQVSLVPSGCPARQQAIVQTSWSQQCEWSRLWEGRVNDTRHGGSALRHHGAIGCMNHSDINGDLNNKTPVLINIQWLNLKAIYSPLIKYKRRGNRRHPRYGVAKASRTRNSVIVKWS